MRKSGAVVTFSLAFITMTRAASAQHDEGEPTPASVRAQVAIQAPGEPKPGEPKTDAAKPAPTSAPRASAPAIPSSPAVPPPVAPSPPSAQQPASPVAASRGYGFLPSLAGPIGLFRMSSAEVGIPGHLRLALHGEYFWAKDVLVDADEESRLVGALRLGYTLTRHVELFGAVTASNNKNVRVEDGRRDPELIRAFGDVLLGVKAGSSIGTVVSIAGEAGLRLMSSASGLSFDGDATSAWVNGIATADLRGLARPIPLRLHLNAGYYQDNSSNVYSLRVPEDVTQTTKEVAMFAYGIARSRLRAAFGVELPFDRISQSVGLRPFAEYHLEWVTAEADSDFETCAGAPCADNRDLHWVTLGLRLRAWKGLTAELGADIRIREPGFPFGTRMAPYNVIAGLALPIDIDALLTPKVVTLVVERTVERPLPPPAAHLVGVVLNAKDGTPVGGAVIGVVGQRLSRVATDSDGTFRSGDLRPGPTEIDVVATGYESTKVRVAPQSGKDISVEVKLTPRIPVGNLRGRITDVAGKGIEGASVKLMGADNYEAHTDTLGAFATALPAGRYQARVDAPGLVGQEAPVEVVGDQERELNLTLAPAAPPLPSAKTPQTVTIVKDSLRLKLPIRFVGSSANLAKNASSILNDLAEAMLVNPDIKRLRIEAHWDSSMTPEKAQLLTGKQADAVKSYLIGKGIPESRLEAVGLGSTKPKVPNVGPAKSRNRRVELRIER